MSTKVVLIIAVLLVGGAGTGWFIYNRVFATASASASAGAETGSVTVVVPGPDPQAGERLRQAIGKPQVRTTAPSAGTFDY